MVAPDIEIRSHHSDNINHTTVCESQWPAAYKWRLIYYQLNMLISQHPDYPARRTIVYSHPHLQPLGSVTHFYPTSYIPSLCKWLQCPSLFQLETGYIPD